MTEDSTFLHSQDEIKLDELLDLNQIQKSFDCFTKIVPISLNVKDIKGNSLILSDAQNICTDFHKKNPETLSKCLGCIGTKATDIKKGEFKLIKCPNGLYEAGTPVYINERHLGCLLAGQFFLAEDPPDYDFFRNQASKHGFDCEKYFEALNKVPVYKRDAALEILSFVRIWSENLYAAGLKNLRLSKIINENSLLLNQLRESEEKYRVIVENQNDIVIKVENGGKFSYISPSYCKFFGAKEEDIIGKVSMPTIDKEDVPKLMKALELLRRPPHLLTYEARHHTPEGTRWIEWKNKAVIDEKGNLSSVIGTGRDITEKKLLEESLIAGEAQKNAMVANILDVVILADEKLSIKYVSPNIKKLFGWEPDELIGKNALDLLRSEDAILAATIFEKLKTGKKQSRQANLSSFRKVQFAATF